MPTLERGEPLHRQLAQQIRTQIAAGVLRDGQLLSSDRQLAAEWNVSTFTVKQAMDLLIEEGLVVSKARSGRVVNAPNQRPDVERPTGAHAVLIGGYAGSGKTELGRILARSTGWPMLDKDTLTRPVVEAVLELYGRPFYDRDSSTYLEMVRPREYQALSDTLRENLECGNSAIVTAPFIKEFADKGWLDRMAATCRELEVTLSVVWVHTTLDTMHMYLRHRGAARDTTKLEEWPTYSAGVDVDFRPPVAHTDFDNNPEGESLQAQAKAFLADLLKDK